MHNNSNNNFSKWAASLTHDVWWLSGCEIKTTSGRYSTARVRCCRARTANTSWPNWSRRRTMTCSALWPRYGALLGNPYCLSLWSDGAAVSLMISHHLSRSVASCDASAMSSFWCVRVWRIYRVYEFRLENNVLVSSQLVFTSRELVTKKAAPVSDLHLVSIIACTRSRR